MTLLNISIKRDGEWESLVVDEALIRLDAYDQEYIRVKPEDDEVEITRNERPVYRARIEEP